jgi:hypothetical protein
MPIAACYPLGMCMRAVTFTPCPEFWMSPRVVIISALLPSLRYHVGHIVELRAEKKVLVVNTAWLIALVQSPQRVRVYPVR